MLFVILLVTVHHKVKFNIVMFLSFYFSSNSNLSNIFRPKKKNLCDINCRYCSLAECENICFCKYCIYIVKCQICTQVYIGETKRILKHRIAEHLTKNSSAVFKHHANNHSGFNIFNTFSFNVLHYNIKHDNTRLIIESFLIKKNMSNLMNGCEGVHTYLNIIQ